MAFKSGGGTRENKMPFKRIAGGGEECKNVRSAICDISVYFAIPTSQVCVQPPTFASDLLKICTVTSSIFD